MELFPVQKKFPSISPENGVTSAAADIPETLQNPAPSISILQLGGGGGGSGTKNISGHIQHGRATIIVTPSCATYDSGNTQTITVEG